jgi:hypothetical protein
MKWAKTLGQHDPDKVVLLYAPDGVLWGTLSPTLRADRAALRDYFVTAFKVLPNLKVTFGERLIRVYGRTAVNTGYYMFSYIKDGETKTLPARYTQLPADWERLYGYRPLLLETLVDAHFRGTSYRAANWIYLGETRGRGRMDQHHKAHGRSMKRIYVYPLCRDVQQRLIQDSPPRWIE